MVILMESVLVLAYIGDSVFELYVREMLIKRGIVKINLLQKEAIKYVSAVGQVKFFEYLINNNILFEEELEIVRRGRNNSRDFHPKNTDIVTYKKATGVEVLIGYLYLNDKKRLGEVLQYVEVL